VFNSRPNFWENPGILPIILYPFSLIYYFYTKYIFLITKKYKSSCKTICVGNIALGGSGKTPIVIELAKNLKISGKKVCVLSRGFKGKLKGPIFVDVNNHTANEVGDEPLTIVKYCEVIIAKNKIEGLKLAEQANYDYVIFDDGLQNPTIDYDFRILALQNNLGNNHIFPSGPLREKLTDALKRVDCVIMPQELKNDLIIPDASQVNIYHYNFICDTILDNKDSYLLFSGIANPAKFFNLIIKQKIEVKKTFSFPDHYMFSDQDLEKIIDYSKKVGCKIVTTEKDYVRLPESYKKNIIPFYVHLRIVNIESLLEILK
jgi:tetraacyldisaccharide 4'-kinase